MGAIRITTLIFAYIPDLLKIGHATCIPDLMP